MPALNAADIESAVRSLCNANLVAFATETVYGLGGDAHSAVAIRRIYRLKGRPVGHPLIIHVFDQVGAVYWGELGVVGRCLAQAFWPGPLTLIVNRHHGVPTFACGNESTVGLRCPSHPVARELLRAFGQAGGRGIAAPSANRFGGVSPTKAEHVRDDFGDAVPVLDGGSCDIGLESTIVDLSRGFASILRPGDITARQIDQVLVAHALDPLVANTPHGIAESTASDSGTSKTRSPRLLPANETGIPGAYPEFAAQPRAAGTMAAHYAPATRLELVSAAALPDRIRELTAGGQRIAICSAVRPAHAWYWEKAQKNAAEFGARLYSMLREFDQLRADLIMIERPNATSEWAAVNDRLQRAQTGSGSGGSGVSHDVAQE